MIEADGWNYKTNPPEDGDGRKIVSLESDGMAWVGIRHWQSVPKRWVNNGEPLAPGELVLAWRDLPDIARGFWIDGNLHFSFPIEDESSGCERPDYKL